MCHDSSLDGRGLLSLCHTEPNLQRNMLYLGMHSGGIKLWTNSWSRLPIFNVRPVSERGFDLPMAAWSVLTNCRPASRMSANPKPRPKHASPQATSLGHSTKDMYTAEASAMAESRHRARASGSAAMSQSQSTASSQWPDERRAGLTEPFLTVERRLCRRLRTEALVA